MQKDAEGKPAAERKSSILIIVIMSRISFHRSFLIVTAWHLQKSPPNFWSQKQRSSFPRYSCPCHTGKSPFKAVWKSPTQRKGQMSPACLWPQPECIHWLNCGCFCSLSSFAVCLLAVLLSWVCFWRGTSLIMFSQYLAKNFQFVDILLPKQE